MTEWGKAMRPSLHDVMQQSNANASALQDMDKLEYVEVTYTIETPEEIIATVSKTYDDLVRYYSDYNTAIVYDGYFNDTTLATVAHEADYVTLAYGFSSLSDETQVINYTDVTVHVMQDNSAEVIIESREFAGGGKFDVFTVNITYAYTPSGRTTTIDKTYNDFENFLNTTAADKRIFIVNYESTSQPRIKRSAIANYTYDYIDYHEGDYYAHILSYTTANDTTGSLPTRLQSITVHSVDFYTTTRTVGTHDIQIANYISGNQIYDGQISESKLTNAVQDKLNNPTIPIASANTLGGVKVGSGLSIDSNGVLSAAGERVPTALVFYNYNYDDDEIESFEYTTDGNNRIDLTNLTNALNFAQIFNNGLGIIQIFADSKIGFGLVSVSNNEVNIYAKMPQNMQNGNVFVTLIITINSQGVTHDYV